MSAPWLLLVATCCQCLLVSCRPNSEETTRPSGNKTEDLKTESSEYVFSPEQEYINAKEIEKMLHVDSRGPEVAPFESKERLWGTPPPPDGPWGKAKKMVKKLFRLDKTTERRPWNVTKELMGDYIIRRMKEMHRYIKYTVLNRPTPNATQPREEITEDPMDFWRAHYTDWKYFNQLHHEIMNASVPEAHWFYRTIMVEGYGINLDDISTTTPKEFDVHRMDGFSTNVTLPPTTPVAESELDSRYSRELPDEVRAVLTMRPAFHAAIDKYLASLSFPTLPQIEIRPGVTGLVESPLFRKMQKKLMSFYYITTRDPEEWMDSRESKKHAKLKKWLAKEEKRVLASVERHVDAYVPEFGPEFNKYYASIANFTASTSIIERKDSKEFTEQVVETTMVEPQHVRDAFSEGREVNVTVLERWLYEHCSNNTIEWFTTQPRTLSTHVDVTVTERVTQQRNTKPAGPTMSSPQIMTIPKHRHEQLMHDNFTMDRDKINHMMLIAQKHMRNLSLFKIESNWDRVSQAMHEAQFTTTVHVDSQEAYDMFTDKLRNY